MYTIATGPDTHLPADGSTEGKLASIESGAASPCSLPLSKAWISSAVRISCTPREGHRHETSVTFAGSKAWAWKALIMGCTIYDGFKGVKRSSVWKTTCSSRLRSAVEGWSGPCQSGSHIDETKISPTITNMERGTGVCTTQ